MCVHVCLCVCSLLRFNLFFVSLTALSPSAFCSTEQQTTFILPSVNERDSERGRERERERQQQMKHNKNKTAQEELLTGCVSALPAVCRLLLTAGCRAMRPTPTAAARHVENEHLSRSTLTGGESRRHICRLPLLTTSQGNLDLLASRDYFSKLFNSGESAKKKNVKKSTSHSERIHPVQFEFIAGQVGFGLQAVAVHLVFGHEHGDGATLQVHFHITFL